MITIKTLNKSQISEAVQPILTEAYKRIDYEAKFVVVPPARAISDVNKGKFDASSLRLAGIEQYYKNIIRVNEPLLEINGMAYIQKSRDINITGIKDLAKYKLATIRGHKRVSRTLDKSDIPFIYASDSKDGIKMLRKGRVDILLTSERDGKLAIKLLGIKNIKPILYLNLFLS